MSPKIRQALSTLLTGALGGAMALAILALLSLGPLQARGSQWNPFARPVPPTCATQPTPSDICLSNEKRIGLGLLEYEQDYDGSLPSGTQPIQTASGPIATRVGWAGQIQPYLKLVTVFKCPLDKTDAVKPDFVVSYALNNNLQTINNAYFFANPSQSVEAFEIGGDKAQVSSADEGASFGATLFSAAGNGTDGSVVAGLGGSVVPSTYYATGYMGGRPRLATGSQFKSATPRDNPSETDVLYLDGHANGTIPGNISTGTDAANRNSPQTGGVTGAAAGADYVGSDGTNYTATFSLI